MHTKKIIPCLDIKDGKVVKGINFKGLRNAGDPVSLAKKYEEDGADELVFLDISATLEKRKTLLSLVKQIADQIQIPFIVGGGISSLQDAENILAAGADKISIGSAAIKNPALITAIAQKHGKQAVVVAIDAKNTGEHSEVYVKGGTENTGILALSWAKKVATLGAGEILLTTMHLDGTKNGFDLELTDKISKAVSIPVIASGGAGNIDHFVRLFKETNAAAGLAASIFHFNEVSIKALKNNLKTHNIPIQ